MPESMRDYSYAAEYYFEYKIEKIFGDKNIQTPKIYFEWDYTNQVYSIYTVPNEWLDKQNTVLANIDDQSDGRRVREELAKLPYDEVNVAFDINGIDCRPLSDKKSFGYQNANKYVSSFKRFYDDGCRIMIEDRNSQDRSGVGVLEMIKQNKVVAKFLFAINFTFRKKIEYSIDIKGARAYLEFTCKDRPVNIPVRVVYNKDRLPCLKNDMNVNIVSEFTLDFSEGQTFQTAVRLSEEAADTNNIFSVTIADKAAERFYMLNCKKNSSLKIKAARNSHMEVRYSCPYCHAKISNKVADSERYGRGGISCRGTVTTNKGKELPVVFNKQGAKLRKCIYCSEDIDQDGRFFIDYARLLPSSFLDRDSFKIAFTGSPGAGKTTLISRFFDIVGDENKVGMPMTTMSRTLQRFNIDLKRAAIPRITRTDSYKITDEDWIGSQEVYTERAMNLYPSRFPNRTETASESTHGRTLTNYPFITEINNRAYISFYDAAGEDARGKTLVASIANEDVVGVFFVVNGKKDETSNNRVAEQLRSSNLDKRCPVAVIVAKMDLLEPEFDSNSYCLRTDYFDGSGTYEGSPLEHMIDYSSEEIRSYLKHTALLPNLEGFNNVKYFGVSSFNFLDSIHDKDDDANTPGKLKFICSSKRMELPFVWMLKQFGLIN